MMMKTRNMLNNDKGSAIIIAVLVLVFLTIIGIAATSTSIFESQIIGNEHNYQIDFYLADSGIEHASVWLESRASAPTSVNPDDPNTVKNWGDTPSGDPDYVKDLDWVIDNGKNPDNISLSQYGRAYWFQIEVLEDSAVPGSGPAYREYVFMVESRAGELDRPAQSIETNLVKVFRMGY